jgi:hypothetical protein
MHFFFKAIQPPIIAGSKIVEEIDFSIAEPDLIIHSISSQDTVIASTCECLSPHELSDSSDSEICGTTFELSATVKNMCQKHESKKKIVSEDEDEDFKPLKTNEERITKRRIISESDTAKNKKIKIESKEDEKLNTRGSVESITKLSVDDSEDTSLPLLPRLSPCTKMVERSLPEQLIQNCQNLVLVASINEDSELPVALENNIHTSVKEKIKVSKDDHKLEKAEEYPRISALQHISEDSNKIRPVSAEAVSPTKTAKKATKVLKQKLQLKKKPETNSKRDVTNLKQCRDESCDSSKPTGIIHSTIVDNGLPKNDELGGFEAVPSKNTQITQDPVHIFKPPSPPLRVAVKWKPPGKSITSQLITFQVLNFFISKVKPAVVQIFFQMEIQILLQQEFD